VEHELNGRSAAEEEDVRLMDRARDGDVEAFSLLVRRHRERVSSFLYRLSWDREKAEDGAQEVFLRVWLSRRRYEPSARFTTFLYQIAQNYWLDQVRKARARPAEVELTETTGERRGPLPRAPAVTEPQHQLFLRYQQWRIRQAIARLPERHRLVFVLAHLEGYRLAEVAEMLEVPVGTVKSRMNTAVRLLRGWLAPEEGEENDDM
jgi:RNA polymerase sigma-70 factor (ECF subfamily)